MPKKNNKAKDLGDVALKPTTVKKRAPRKKKVAPAVKVDDILGASPAAVTPNLDRLTSTPLTTLPNYRVQYAQLEGEISRGYKGNPPAGLIPMLAQLCQKMQAFFPDKTLKEIFCQCIDYNKLTFLLNHAYVNGARTNDLLEVLDEEGNLIRLRVDEYFRYWSDRKQGYFIRFEMSEQIKAVGEQLALAAEVQVLSLAGASQDTRHQEAITLFTQQLLYKNFIEQLLDWRTLLVDYLRQNRQFRSVRLESHPWIKAPYLTADKGKPGQIVQCLPLPGLTPKNKNIDEAIVAEVVADFELHLPEVWRICDWILAARVAGSRKNAYLIFHAASNFGKGFLFAGVFKELGIVIDVSVEELIKAASGGTTGLLPADFRNAWITLMEESKDILGAIKRCDETLKLTPKYAMHTEVPIYAKVFTQTSTLPKSIVGGFGVDQQNINRFSYINRHQPGAVSIKDRPVFQKHSGVIYRQALEIAVARYLNEELGKYRQMTQADGEATAESVLQSFWNDYNIGLSFENLENQLPALVEDIRHFARLYVGFIHHDPSAMQLKPEEYLANLQQRWSGLSKEAMESLALSIRTETKAVSNGNRTPIPPYILMTKKNAERLIELYQKVSSAGVQSNIEMNHHAILEALHDHRIVRNKNCGVAFPSAPGNYKTLDKAIAFFVD